MKGSLIFPLWFAGAGFVVSERPTKKASSFAMVPIDWRGLDQNLYPTPIRKSWVCGLYDMLQIGPQYSSFFEL